MSQTPYMLCVESRLLGKEEKKNNLPSLYLSSLLFLESKISQNKSRARCVHQEIVLKDIFWLLLTEPEGRIHI